jgi:hypothetical protein
MAILFDALSVMFVMPSRSRRARDAVRASVGDTTFEMLAAYLAFVRTAHFWTELHPELAFESDMVDLMAEHQRLKELILGPSDADRVRCGAEVKAMLGTMDLAVEPRVTQ